MKGATTKRTRKEAEASAAAAGTVDYIRIPSEQEFRDALVIISVLKKLGHPEGWDFAAARIIPKQIEKRPRRLFRDSRGYLAIPHLPLATSDAPDERELKFKEMHDSISESRFDLQGPLTPGWQGCFAYGMAMNNGGMPTAAEMRAIASESFPQFRQYFPQYFDDTSTLDYIKDSPSSETADTSPQLRMRDDFNIALAVSRYELLARRVDLLNPRLSEVEKVTRAERLVKAYKRLRKVNPHFHDDGKQLKAARSITNRANYRRKIAKAGEKAKLAM